jgi:hypothetical protein
MLASRSFRITGIAMGRFRPESNRVTRIWDGRTWEVRNAVVVKDERDVIAAYTPASSTALIATGPDSVRLRLPPAEWDMTPAQIPPDRSFLAVHPTGTGHSTILIQDGSWRLLCWYINLETALKRTATGFEYTDHFLMSSEPDLMGWKDEDELVEAVDRGLSRRRRRASTLRGNAQWDGCGTSPAVRRTMGGAAGRSWTAMAVPCT